MRAKPAISIVGAGRLAIALAPALQAAGYRVDQVVGRDEPPSLRRARQLARAVNAEAVRFSQFRPADVIWLCVGDGAIAACARELEKHGDWKGRVVLHSSGALSSDELAPLRKRGAHVAALHPMMTFVHDSRPSLAGVGFALEGDAVAVRLARRIARDLGGEVFSIRKSAKPLYHAWGAFGSPLLVIELALAERVAQAAGLPPGKARKVIAPLVRRTIDNYFQHGAAAAFSGPLVRGDVETVQRHLRYLAKIREAREAYLALARSALKILPVGRKKEMRKILR